MESTDGWSQLNPDVYKRRKYNSRLNLPFEFDCVSLFWFQQYVAYMFVDVWKIEAYFLNSFEQFRKYVETYLNIGCINILAEGTIAFYDVGKNGWTRSNTGQEGSEKPSDLEKPQNRYSAFNPLLEMASYITGILMAARTRKKCLRRRVLYSRTLLWWLPITCDLVQEVKWYRVCSISNLASSDEYCFEMNLDERQGHVPKRPGQLWDIHLTLVSHIANYSEEGLAAINLITRPFKCDYMSAIYCVLLYYSSLQGHFSAEKHTAIVSSDGSRTYLTLPWPARSLFKRVRLEGDVKLSQEQADVIKYVERFRQIVFY